jgi:archaellum component FlaC
VPLCNLDDVFLYIRKLKEENAAVQEEKVKQQNATVKEENVLLKDRLVTVEKEQQEKQKMDMKALQKENEGLQTKVERVSQYGAVKDMERLMERYDEMERKFEEMKDEMGRQASVLEDSKENLASVRKKMEQVSNEMEPMKSNFSELVSVGSATGTGVTLHGIKYFWRDEIRTGPQTSLHRNTTDGLTIHTVIGNHTGRNRRNPMPRRWKLVLC